MQPSGSRSNRSSVRIALGELKRVSKTLSVPDVVTHEAAGLCTRRLAGGLTKGMTPTQVGASSVYAACREKEVPTTLGEVSAASGVDRDDIAKCYRSMVVELNLKIPVPEPADFIDVVAARAGVSPRVQEAARSMLLEAAKAGITAGVYPNGLVASALYLASLANGERLTQIHAAEAAGVAESTVQKENKRLRKVIGVLGLSLTKRRGV